MRETFYGRYMADKSSAGTLTEGEIQNALRDVYESTIKDAGEALAITAFRARHDFHNLKVLARERLLCIAREDEALSSVGSFSAETLDRMLDGEFQDAEFPLNRPDMVLEKDALASAYGDVKAAIDSERDSWGPTALALICDTLLDVAYYGWAGKMLKRLGYANLAAFLTAEVDLLNLRMAYRSLKQKIPASLYERVVLPGGTVKTQDLKGAYGDGADGFLRLYKSTPWEKASVLGAGALKRNEPLTSFEKSCDDSLMRVYRKSRRVPLGPEPILGYILGKESEARNVRVLIAGKISGAPAPDILERLRETYV